jgi:hypothetical protein
MDRRAEWPRPGDLVELDHRAGNNQRFAGGGWWGLVAAVEPARFVPGWFYVDVDLVDAQGRPVERVLVFSCPAWLTIHRRQ